MNKFYLIVLLLILTNLTLCSKEPLNTVDIKIIDENRIVLVHQNVKLVQIQVISGELIHQLSFDDSPTGVAVNGNRLFVTTSDINGKLIIFDLTTFKKLDEFVLGMGARSPIVTEDGKRVYVCCQFTNEVSEIDLGNKKIRSVKAVREPYNCLLAEKETKLYVSNFLPDGKANIEIVTSKITLIDTKNFTVTNNIALTNGSNALRGLCLSPDGKHLFISHNLGHFQVPTSQLQQGWMNTNAISVINVSTDNYIASFLTDKPERGSAGIWDIKCNSKWMYVSHSGIHKISKIDYAKMIERFEDRIDKDELSYDLRFLNGIRNLYPTIGNGPRIMALGSEKLFVVTYFSDTLNTFDIETAEVSAMALNPDFIETVERKGERIFNDATNCFQSWQSCNGCHPGDARTDGLNWDLLNDGIGNPKNCKSLLKSHVTPPAMITGIRPDAETAVRAGFKHIQFTEISEEDASAVDVYLTSLEPLVSPYRIDGKLTKAAEEGKLIFNKIGCGSCHNGSNYTDMEMYSIGKTEFEKGWDTPTLVELWRTAPYLHDGSIYNLDELFSEAKHGLKNQELTKSEINNLVVYINSL